MRAKDAGIDLVAYDPKGRVVLLAEAKSRGSRSPAWASKLRGNMLAHRALPQAQYFLIATPERIYLWRQGDSSYNEAAPDFIIDAIEELKPYFEKFHQRPSEIGPEEFELLVSSWLTNIAWSGEDRRNEDLSLGWLVESNFVLERALQQEQSDSCSEIMDLASKC
jgi:hypothetical protein